MSGRIQKTVYDAEADVFTAIAHPVRRQLLDQLVPGAQSVSALAAHFSVSRPAISQHLRILLTVELVTEQRVGRERRYSLHPERLQEIEDWLRPYAQFWHRKLGALGTFLDQEHDT